MAKETSKFNKYDLKSKISEALYSTNGKRNKKKLAIIVSTILHPIVMTVIIAFAISIRFELSIQVFLAVFSVPFLMISTYIVFSVFIFKINDIEFTDVKKRPPLLIVSNIGLLIALGVSNILSPQLSSVLNRMLIIFICIAIISFYWKISLHSTFFTMTIVLLSIYFDLDYLIFLILTPSLYWSRTYLYKHKINQLMAGSIISLLLLL